MTLLCHMEVVALEWVAFVAVRFPSVSSGGAFADFHIEPLGDQPHVLDVDAGPVAAQVIDDQELRDRAILDYPCDSMRWASLAFLPLRIPEVKPAVAVFSDVPTPGDASAF